MSRFPTLPHPRDTSIFPIYTRSVAPVQGSGARRGLAIGGFHQPILSRNVWYPLVATYPLPQAE